MVLFLNLLQLAYGWAAFGSLAVAYLLRIVADCMRDGVEIMSYVGLLYTLFWCYFWIL